MKKYLIAVGILLCIFAGFAIYGNRVELELKNQEASERLKEREERNNQKNTADADIDLFIPTEPPPDVYDKYGEVIDRSIMRMTPEEILEDYEYMWNTIEEYYQYYSDFSDNGVDEEQIKQKYLDEINAHIEWYSKRQQSVISDAVYWFSDLTERCLAEFNLPEVLYYINPQICYNYYNEFKDSEYYTDIFSNDKVSDVHQILFSDAVKKYEDNTALHASDENWVILPNSGLLFRCFNISP